MDIIILFFFSGKFVLEIVINVLFVVELDSGESVLMVGNRVKEWFSFFFMFIKVYFLFLIRIEIFCKIFIVGLFLELIV